LFWIHVVASPPGRWSWRRYCKGVDAPGSLPITQPLVGASARVERWLTVVIVVVPFVGLIVAMPVFWNRGLSGLDLSLFLSFYLFVGFGVTVGLHRLLTHRSFDAPRWVKAGFAIAGSMAIEASAIRWVAVHRRHHAFSDRAGDPHSPHLGERPGIRGVLANLWHAHMGWLFDNDQTSLRRFAPDLLKDRAIRTVDRLFPVWALLSIFLPGVIGFALTGTFYGAATAFLWGGLVRIFFLHHVTFSINSICHYFGKRPFEVPDESTNNWLLSVISLGEAWHNNHHAFPTSARHGLLPGQPDPSGALIRVLEKLRCASAVKHPTEKQMAVKRRERY
jgi:stearoyl-CoA desaturase (delta-9 desaturase)